MRTHSTGNYDPTAKSRSLAIETRRKRKRAVVARLLELNPVLPDEWTSATKIIASEIRAYSQRHLKVLLHGARTKLPLANTKKCRLCRRVLPADQFHPDQARKKANQSKEKRLKSEPTYLKSHCKECANVINARRMRLRKWQELGITEEGYNSLLKLQGGRCAICQETETTGELDREFFCVDHDHKTGRVRGLLCNRCNPGIGYFRDDPQLLEAAIAYLKKSADFSVLGLG